MTIFAGGGGAPNSYKSKKWPGETRHYTSFRFGNSGMIEADTFKRNVGPCVRCIVRPTCSILCHDIADFYEGKANRREKFFIGLKIAFYSFIMLNLIMFGVMVAVNIVRELRGI